jgi:hypothetical protein
MPTSPDEALRHDEGADLSTALEQCVVDVLSEPGPHRFGASADGDA